MWLTEEMCREFQRSKSSYSINSQISLLMRNKCWLYTGVQISCTSTAGTSHLMLYGCCDEVDSCCLKARGIPSSWPAPTETFPKAGNVLPFRIRPKLAWLLQQPLIYHVTPKVGICSSEYTNKNCGCHPASCLISCTTTSFKARSIAHRKVAECVCYTTLKICCSRCCSKYLD